jgi:predicted SnoaL-like aldol condensation-catalyzing enzyme
MTTTTESSNKAIVAEAFETLFNRRDYDAANRFWAEDYIQHSAHIPSGREGLFDLIKSVPADFRHETDFIMAEGDYLMVRGRFSGLGERANWIAVDLIRMENGLLAEHWDVIEDEATRESSASGLPAYGASFPNE